MKNVLGGGKKQRIVDFELGMAKRALWLYEILNCKMDTLKV